MRSYKELLTEMLNPLPANKLEKILKRMGFDTFNKTSSNSEIAELVVSPGDDKAIEDEYFFDNIDDGKKKLDKFLSKYHWYVNQSRSNAMLLQQRNVHDINRTVTADPTVLKDDEDDTPEGESDIREYGFIHVSDVPPNVMARTGIRAKSSGTFDKHDEKRIYLFSLAPQFITNRDNITEYMSKGNLGVSALATIMTDDGVQLSSQICMFMDRRYEDKPGVEKYVYFIDKLQKPAKIYRDSVWGANLCRDAVYTKDYSIPPSNIKFLCTYDELREATVEYGRNMDLDFDSIDTAVDYVEKNDISDVPINDERYINIARSLCYDDLHVRRAMKLAVKLLHTQYNFDVTYDQLFNLLLKQPSTLSYLTRFAQRADAAIYMIKGVTEERRQQVVRRVYGRLADAIVATALLQADYRERKQSKL